MAFIATTTLTILALAGLVKIADKKYLDRLFIVLILEIVASGFFIFTSGLAPEQKYFMEARATFEEALRAKDAKEIEKADELFSKVLKIPTEGLPLDIRHVFRERGHMAYDRKIWGRAAVAYRIFDEVGEADIEVLTKLGRSLRAINQYEEAEQAYERALKISPNNYDVLNGLQNVTRRRAAFLFEADREEAAQPLFEKTREHINAMINLSGERSVENKRYLNALSARVALYWQWERYPEAEASADKIVAEYPKYERAKEDLAAIKLEFGKYHSRQDKIEASKVLFQKLHRIQTETTDTIFVGSGLAEATTLSASADKAELDEAEKAVLLAIAESKNSVDDPYAFYAAAVLYRRMGNITLSTSYLKQAIAAERRRSIDPFTFDYVRLVEYEKILTKWENEK
ncbi:tetratricopeptide repeat protein [Breoghania sp. L-A4]|uniref:tetratricopeptide repeat protein n=1 Tax=Breoghania sp. L-A4 TaxID=2304600 RepID=UPI0013C31936|nr:tetratricopeptide repeat protein [Breoghania sp. L-A4]